MEEIGPEEHKIYRQSPESADEKEKFLRRIKEMRLKLRSYEYSVRVIKYKIVQVLSYIKGILEIEEIPTREIVEDAIANLSAIEKAMRELKRGVEMYHDLRKKLFESGIESLPIDWKYYYSHRTAYLADRGKPKWQKEPEDL